MMPSSTHSKLSSVQAICMRTYFRCNRLTGIQKKAAGRNLAYHGTMLMTLVSAIYSDAPLLERALVAARPLICPREPILQYVPNGARILDVGCGVGSTLVSFALNGKVSAGTGCDINARAVEIAKKASARVNLAKLTFLVTKSLNEIPSGPFDVVMSIDVMHHIHVPTQKDFFVACADRVKPNGLFIYKDMADNPAWKSTFNRLHDLVMARQWIHYVPLETVKTWADEAGLQLVNESAYNRLAYAHEILVLRKP